MRRSDGAACHGDALPVQLGSDLVGPVHLEVLPVDAEDLPLQLLVAHKATRADRFFLTK